MPSSINKNSDYYIYKYIIDPLSKHMCFVHPNLITILNVYLSIPLHYNLKNNGKILYLILIMTMNRFLDLLDGSIARSCNKKTKLGSILDILCDFIITSTGFITFLIQLHKTSLPKKHKYIITFFVSLFLCFLCYIVCIEIFSESWLKKIESKKTFTNKIVIFYHDNSFILGILIPIITKLCLRLAQSKKIV